MSNSLQGLISSDGNVQVQQDDSARTSSQYEGHKPVLLGFRSSKAFILSVVTFAVFTDTFFYTLVIPILPNMLEQRASVPLKQAQKWVSILLSVYALTNLITAPIAGLTVDKSRGRRGPLLLGLIIMAVSTTMFAFGRTVYILVVARALQGSAAAFVRVCGLALITDTYGADKAGAAMGWQSIGMFFGNVLGTSMSGILYDNFGYLAVFTTAYVVLLLDMLLRLFMIERKSATQWTCVRDQEAAMDTTERLSPESHESLLQQAMSNSWDPKNSYGSICENETDDTRITRSRKPTIIVLLADRRIVTALWATFVCAIILTSLESIVPLYTARLFCWTTTKTGLLLVALAASITVDPLLGSLTDKYGSRWFSVAGFTATTAVYAILTMVTNNQSLDKVLICVSFIILGFAIGSIFTPNTVEISQAVYAKEKLQPNTFRAEKAIGQAYALLSVAYGVGSLVGPAWGGGLIATQGWTVLCVSLAILAGASTVIMLLFAGEHQSDSTRHE